MTTVGVTSNGFVPKTFSEILDSLILYAKSEFGEDIDTTSTSPLYQLMRVFAFEIAYLWQIAEDVFYGNFIATASGSQLDGIADNFGITRNAATYASGIVTFSRSSPADKDYTIPSGTVVQTDPYTEPIYRFETTSSVVLSSGSTSVDCGIIAQVPGADHNVPANTIQYFYTSVFGVDSVTNASATTGGADAESDENLRLRLRQALWQAGRATKNSIIAAIEDLDGVTDAVVVEGTASATVYVLGGNDTEISATIEEYRPIGVTVSWERPTPASTTVTCTVQKFPSVDSAVVIAQVSSNLDTYFNNKTIGDDIQYSDVLKAIVEADDVDQVTALTISATTSSGAVVASSLGDVISIDNSEYAVKEGYTITVV